MNTLFRMLVTLSERGWERDEEALYMKVVNILAIMLGGDSQTCITLYKLLCN